MPEPDPRALYVAGALISGPPAVLIARVMSRSSIRAELAEFPPAVTGAVEEAVACLKRAGDDYLTSERRNSEVMPAEVELQSDHEDDEPTTEEAGDMLGVSPRRILQLLADGRLSGRKRAGRWLLDRACVYAYRNTTGGTSCL
jgi:hypothetical protein